MIIEGKTYKVVSNMEVCKQGSRNWMLNGPRGGEYMFTVMADGRAFIMRMGGMNPKMTKVANWSE